MTKSATDSSTAIEYPIDRHARIRLRWGGRLDRYVVKLFLASYAVAFLLVVGLFLIVDLAQHLDDYLKPGPSGQTPPLLQVVHYYSLEMPFLYLQLAPLVTLLAGLFTLAKLLRYNEVVAILGAGISSQRLLAPVFGCAVLLALGMFTMREWFTEQIGFRRDAAKDRLLERRHVPEYHDLWLKDAGANPVRLGRFLDAEPAQALDFEATILETTGGKRWINFEASKAVWHEGRWRLENGFREELDRPELGPAPLEYLEGIEFSPRDARVAQKARKQPLELSFREVRELMARDPDNVQYQTLLQYHLTFPLANVVLLLVGLPLLLRRDRSQLEGLAVGFLFCVVYFGVDFLTRSLGMQGSLSPILSSWTPVLFFGSLGVVFFGSMRS